MNKQKLIPTSTRFGMFFWITYFVCISLIFLFNDLTTKICMFLIMTLITLHFWTRSDYLEQIQLNATKRIKEK